MQFSLQKTPVNVKNGIVPFLLTIALIACVESNDLAKAQVAHPVIQRYDSRYHPPLYQQLPSRSEHVAMARPGLFNRRPQQSQPHHRMSLSDKLDHCIKLYANEKQEDINGRSPWGIMHAAIGLGKESQCIYGNRRVNAIDWLKNNGMCRGERLMLVENGQLKTRLGPGFEGHEGQLLAILAQCGVGPHEKIHVDGHEFTVVNLIKKEMDSCRPGTELTFKLIGLSYYLDSDATWKSSDGEQWDIQRLILEELKQPINGVACGGSHRLMSFTFSAQCRKMQGKEAIGQWKHATDFIKEYQRYTFSLQNPDGSFSTQWFERREMKQNYQRKLQTTGHILEWLVFSLEEEQLRDPRLIRAVNFLADLMIEQQHTKWSVGPKGHAIRALVLFKQRYYLKQNMPIRFVQQAKSKPPASPVSHAIKK